MIDLGKVYNKKGLYNQAISTFQRVLNLDFKVVDISIKNQVQELIKFAKKEFEKQTSELREKLTRMLNVSTRLNLNRMQNALDMDKRIFDNKIFEWAEEFSFTIDGDYLLINKETVSDFIDALDDEYKKWVSQDKADR